MTRVQQANTEAANRLDESQKKNTNTNKQFLVSLEALKIEASFNDFLEESDKEEARKQRVILANSKLASSTEPQYQLAPAIIPSVTPVVTHFNDHLDDKPFQALLDAINKIKNPVHRQILTATVQQIGPQAFAQAAVRASAKAQQQSDVNSKPPAQNPDFRPAPSAPAGRENDVNAQANMRSVPTQSTTQKSQNTLTPSKQKKSTQEQPKEGIEDEFLKLISILEVQPQSAMFYMLQDPALNLLGCLKNECRKKGFDRGDFETFMTDSGPQFTIILSSTYDLNRKAIVTTNIVSFAENIHTFTAERLAADKADKLKSKFGSTPTPEPIPYRRK